MARELDKAFLEKTSRQPVKQKKKIHERADESRYAKINFKRYLREIEESLSTYDEDEEDLE